MDYSSKTFLPHGTKPQRYFGPMDPSPSGPHSQNGVLMGIFYLGPISKISALTRELCPDWLLQSEKLEQLKFVTGKPSLAGVENAPGEAG